MQNHSRDSQNDASTDVPAPAPRTRFAVIGFGNMGSAVIQGAIRAGTITARDVTVIELDPDRRALADALGCVTSADIAAAHDVHQIVLATKPQAFPGLAPELARRHDRAIFTSVMAGIPGRSILDAVGLQHGVVRTMPNTPCAIGAGMTAIALSAGATDGDDALAMKLFAAVGRVVRVDERLFDAVTATSGSGPAYVFLLAEAWEDAAIERGFDRTTARELVRQTLFGAALMLRDPSVDAAALRAAVTSKGGTTAAAIDVLETRGFRAMFAQALVAAEERGRALAARP